MYGQGGYGNGYTNGYQQRPRPTTWYVPKNSADEAAFESTRNEIKSALLVNKEGVTATRILNFLKDIGVEIDEARFNLTFNELLFHCQDFLQVRVFNPRISSNRSRYLFISSYAVDAEAQHLLDLVKGQMADKKRSGLPRPTLRNTIPVPASELLSGPPPIVYDRPLPTVVARRGSSGRSNGNPRRGRFVPPRFSTPSPFSNDRSSGRGGGSMETGSSPAPLMISRPLALNRPSYASSSLTTSSSPNSYQVPRIAPISSLPEPSSIPFVRSVPIPPATSSDSSDYEVDSDIDEVVTAKCLPNAFNRMHPNVVSPTAVPARPLARKMEASDLITTREPAQPKLSEPEPPRRLAPPVLARRAGSTPTPPVVASMPLPKCVTVELSDPVPTAVPSTVAPRPLARRASRPEVEIPDGYVHPIKNFPPENLDMLLDRVAKEYCEGHESLFTATLTGFNEDDPSIFYLKLKELCGQVSRVEHMMKVFYDWQVKKVDRKVFIKEDIMLHGIYAGHDEGHKTWRRVQVLEIKKDIPEGQKPLSVFLIDHGKILDLNCRDLLFLTPIYSVELRHAYQASFAYLQHEPKMNKLAANLFLQLSTGRTFLCFLRDVDSAEGSIPNLKIRFAMNLDKEGIKGI